MAQYTQLVVLNKGVVENRAVLVHSQKVVLVAADNVQIVLVDPETAQPAQGLRARKAGDDLVIADETG